MEPGGGLGPARGAAVLIGALLTAGALWAAVVSRREGERLAAARFLGGGLLLALPYLVAGLASFPYRTEVAAALVVAALVAAGAVLLSFGRPPDPGDDTPRTRIDERDIMFSRNLLKPGTERFEAYYAKHPEHREPDDAFRALPGLMKRGASAYHPVHFSAAAASFTTVEHLRELVDGEPASARVELTPPDGTRFLKGWARKLGAHSVGITTLRPHHLYTHVGRGPDFGRPVTLNHRHAIAFTVEMDHETILHAPLGPTVMESAQQYLASGAVAVQIADLIRRLGYPARAHIDGNYRVVCPLVARDAGLGEIGRMGLLMTPDLGPRVRIAVVTTDLPLETDDRRPDAAMIDFCTRCRKCAEACPSRAIPFEDRQDLDGVRRWRIDSEACFTFWCAVGTDCARCVRVCPYAHPAHALHDLVRAGIRRSGVVRRAAVWMDDLLYGRKPAPEPVRGWRDVAADDAPGAEAAGAKDGDGAGNGNDAES